MFVLLNARTHRRHENHVFVLLKCMHTVIINVAAVTELALAVKVLEPAKIARGSDGDV